MGQHRIAIVTGSLRRDSFNRRFADAFVKLAPPDFSFEQLEIGDLPLYNQDDDDSPAEQVKRLKSDVEKAQGLLFFTPEYNRSVPGVLKNALDHASRPHGRNSWAGKPAGIIGVSIGAVGTAVAQAHLRTILGYLDVPTLGQPEMYLKSDVVLDDDGNLADGSRDFVQDFMDRYVAWVKQHAS